MIFIIIFTDDDFINLKKRDPVIFNKIYKEYKDKIFTFLIIKTKGNKEIAEEIICDTFHSAIESAPNLKNSNNIQAWLFQIASRRLCDHLRKKYKEKKYLGEMGEMNEENLLSNDNLAEDIQTKQEALMLNEALNRLNNKYKEIIKLKYIDNLSLKDICSQMGTSIATVNSLLERARTSLRKEFKKILNGF